MEMWRPTPRENPLNDVLRGLQIAQGIFGIKANLAEAEKLKKDQEIALKKLEYDEVQTAAETSRKDEELKVKQENAKANTTRATAYEDYMKRQKKVSDEKSNTAVAGREVIPGYEKTGNYKIRDVDLAKFQGTVAASDALKTKVNRLNELYKVHGTEITGPVAAEMESLLTSSMMDLKTIDELGVLTGPDLLLLQKQLPDPTSITSGARSLANPLLGDEIQQKLNVFPSIVDERLNAKARAIGLAATGGKEKTETVSSGPPKLGSSTETTAIKYKAGDRVMVDGIPYIVNDDGVTARKAQ